jgi:hypothetical protein
MSLRHLAIALLLGAVAAASGCTGCCHKTATVSSAPPCGCATPLPPGPVPAAPAVPAPVPVAPVPSGYGAASCPTAIGVR